MADSKTTTDHNTIKRWIEDRQGVPAFVAGTENPSEGSGMLRVRFSDDSSQELKEVSWDDFFRVFDDNNLAFLYQEETSDGKESRFFKFINR